MTCGRFLWRSARSGETGAVPVIVFDVAGATLAIAVAYILHFETFDIVPRFLGAPLGAVIPIVAYPLAFAVADRLSSSPPHRSRLVLAAAPLVGMIVVACVVGLAGTLGLAGRPVAAVPVSLIVIQGLAVGTLLGGVRLAARQRGVRHADHPHGMGRRTIVYGAGEAGRAIADLADRDPSTNLEIVGFIDDDPAKAGTQVAGRPVFGGMDQLGAAVTATTAGQLLIAMGGSSAETIRSALTVGRELGLAVRTVPNLRPLRGEDLRPAMIRSIRLEDLLPRRVTDPDVAGLASYLRGASVLLTGGAGSIGQELARQILAMRPARLTIVDQHEEGLWAINRELELLRSPVDATSLIMRLADVRSREAVDTVLARVDPDVVFHAAALKHVPIVEEHPAEGVLTNVIGTRNVLRACEALRVPRFVLISTDKAVDPVGVMGATKRIAELMTIASAQRTGRAYAAVRFGNVLGSSGSVVPTFLAQIAARQPLTITDAKATRYFMTISEAVTLILEAGARAASGGVYVLDMGEPIRIVDLARDLIELAGMDPSDVPIVFTGLRPGERLHEALIHRDESIELTSAPGIRRVRHLGAYGAETAAELDRIVDRLEVSARAQNDGEVRTLLEAALASPTPAAVESQW